MSIASKFYNDKINQCEIIKNKLINKINTIAIIRLAVMFTILLIGYNFYKSNRFLLLSVDIFIGFILFIIIAIYHGNQKQKLNKLNILIDINKNGLKRINGEWRTFSDNGNEYIDENHSYTNDLDVFGNNSIFQWINTTVTCFGRNKLAHKLSLKESLECDDIKEIQKSIKELSGEIQWRQNLICNAKYIIKNLGDPEELIQWSKQAIQITKTMKYIPYLFLAITYGFIISAILGRIPSSFVILVLIMNYCAIKFLIKDCEKQIDLFLRQKKNIYAYSEIFESIEEKKFNSYYLKQLKKELFEDGYSCSREMKTLKNLVEWIGDSKKNAYYFILNILTFSDVFVVCNLEQWRRKNESKLEQWLNIMGEFEALSSISNIAFENEDWEYPDVKNEYLFEGDEVGHPLLNSSSKCNDFRIYKDNICLITGSNMSGKSTFLRTIGTNMLLSYLGAPIRGQNVKCGKFNLYTCMRTKDNLEERISSFYAEIMRIKQIVEAVKSGEKVFFLLDEIFKGTNSEDRHTGAAVLIKQLHESGAVGLVSTHDLELCDLESKYIWLKNYNFREYYENNEIKFDYILRKGKSETRNAIHLMRLAGIKID